MRDANGVDFHKFLLWCVIRVSIFVFISSLVNFMVLMVLSRRNAFCKSFFIFNTEAKTCTMNFSQEDPSTLGQLLKQSMFIPIAVGILDSKGTDIPVTSVSHEGVLESVLANGQPVHSVVLQ